MEIKIDFGVFNGVFAVPNTVTDDYIKLASGDNLKVLLYCLRHCGTALSDGEVARATGVEPDSVATSVEFWKQRGLSDLSVAQQPKQSGTHDTSQLSVKKVSAILDRDSEFSPSEISDGVKSSKEVEYLFSRCEEMYGRPLKHSEQKTLAVIIEDVGMKPEVALMLVEFCFSVGKQSAAHIRKTAKDWFGSGVDTIEQAELRIKELREYNSAENELKRRLKIKVIADEFMPLVGKWLGEYGFTVDMIYEAYQISLKKTGGLEYKYMNTVLENWHKQGVKTVRDIAAANEKRKKAQEYGKKTSYDLDELEKSIMEEWK